MGNERKLFFLPDIFFHDRADGMETADTAVGCNGSGRKEIDAGALQIVSTLKKDLELWLIADCLEAEFDSIPDSKRLRDCFHKTVYLREHGYSYGAMEAYDFLFSLVKAPREQCLFLDHNLKRTIDAIDNGIYAAVIIDNACLEREFLLRRLTDRQT